MEQPSKFNPFLKVFLPMFANLPIHIKIVIFNERSNNFESSQIFKIPINSNAKDIKKIYAEWCNKIRSRGKQLKINGKLVIPEDFDLVWIPQDDKVKYAIHIEDIDPIIPFYLSRGIPKIKIFQKQSYYLLIF